MSAIKVFLFAASLIFSINTYASSNAGVFMIVKGEVHVTKEDGSQQKARMGMQVFAKDTIVAKANSRARIVMIDKNVLNISPDSEIKLSEYSFVSEDQDKNVMIDVVYGKIRSKVVQKYDGKQSSFRVKTKAAVAGVRGTDFLVSHINDRSEVITFSGEVSVGAGLSTNGITNAVSVRPGQMTSVTQNGRPANPVQIPPAQLNIFEKESDAENDDLGSETSPVNENAEASVEDSEEGSTEAEESEVADNKNEPSKDNNSRTPSAGTVMPPPPLPTNEVPVVDTGDNLMPPIAGDFNNLPDLDTGVQNPIIEDIIQQTSTKVNIIINAP